MLSVVPRGGRLLVLGSALAVAAIVVTSCASSQTDRLPGPAEHVATAGRAFTLTREPNHVCAHTASRSLPSCVELYLPLSEAVLGAVLDPLDAEVDLLLFVTRPDVVLDGLPPGAVRAVLGPDESGGLRLAVWLALPPAGTSHVCATVAGAPADGTFGVHRTIENPPGGVAEVAVDEC